MSMLTIHGDENYADDHVKEAMKLDAQGYRHLFGITLYPEGEPEIFLPITPLSTVTWQGYTWETYGAGLTDYKKDSSGEVSRPKFTLFNPKGLWTRYAHQGYLDNAQVVRYRVLKDHLFANVNSFSKNTWRVGKVANAGKNLLVLELREASDGQFFILPPRAFYPPEFPSVNL